MSLSEIARDVIGGCEYETSPVRGLFGGEKGTKIKINEAYTPELFDSIFRDLCERLGNPIYVHSYYGFVWKKEGEFLAYNFIEEYCHGDAIDLFLFRKLPCGKKLTYAYYTQVVQTVKETFAERGFSCNGDRFYNFDHTFYFFGDQKERQCLLSLKGSSLFFSCMRKEPIDGCMTRMVPLYTRKKRILSGDPTAVRRAVQGCFEEE